MADLTTIQAAESVKIIGSDSSGTEQTPVQSTSNGGLHVNIRNNSGGELLNVQLPSNSIPVAEAVSPTFSLLATDIAIGNNKSMISLQNATGSGVVIKIKSIKIVNSQTSAVTGVVADFRLFRFTTHSVGTTLTPLTFDTNDSLNVGVTARTNGTIAGEAASPLLRYEWSTDEWGPGTSDAESTDHTLQAIDYIYKHEIGTKPITLRPNEGVHIKHVVNSTAGTFDIEIIFIQE